MIFNIKNNKDVYLNGKFVIDVESLNFILIKIIKYKSTITQKDLIYTDANGARKILPIIPVIEYIKSLDVSTNTNIYLLNYKAFIEGTEEDKVYNKDILKELYIISQTLETPFNKVYNNLVNDVWLALRELGVSYLPRSTRSDHTKYLDTNLRFPQVASYLKIEGVKCGRRLEELVTQQK